MNYQKTERDLILDFLNHSNVDRFTALTNVLNDQGIEYEVQDCGEGCRNVLVSMTEETNKYALLVAHYDVWPGSTGINDNTASISTLINIINYFKNNNELRIPFKILFTDKEESGMVGSSQFLKENHLDIMFAIVLDIIGYGEKLVSCPNTNKEFFSFLDEYDILNVETTLPSDNLMFNQYNVRNTLIVATHEIDILKNTDSHENENYELSSYPKFYESFHNRVMDGKIEVINFDLIEKLRDSIIDMIRVN